MGWFIVILVFAVWILYNSLQDSEQKLMVEKSKMHNFETLLKIIKQQNPTFNLLHKMQNRTVFEEVVSDNASKLIYVDTDDKKLTIWYYLKSRKNKKTKFFKYNILDDQSKVALYACEGIKTFDKDLIKNHPNFWNS